MKIDRLIAILMVLLNKDKTNAKELADKFEVSTRTIYRDLDSLLIAGIPINTIQGINGGINIEKRFKVDKQFFSTQEITKLLVGLNGIDSILSDEGLNAAYEKVKSLVPETYKEDIQNFTDQIKIDLTTWQGHSSIKDKLKLIKQALEQSLILTFEYVNKKNKLSLRIIEPYKLTYKENSWYLEGYCLKRNDFRMFKLNRMLKLSIGSQNFAKRDFKPLDLTKDGWIKDKLFLIDVKFNHNILEQMIERCGEMNITPIDQKTFEAKMPFTNDSYSYNILLSFGTDIQCLGPQSVIENLKKHIKVILESY